LSPCLLQKLISKTIPMEVAYGEHPALCDIYDEMYATLVCCSRELTPSIDAAGPISCLSNITDLSYLVYADLDMADLPLNCEVVSDGVVRLPAVWEQSDRECQQPTLNTSVQRILKSAEVQLGWTEPDGPSPQDCYYCEHKGGRCAFRSQRNQTFCMTRGIISNWPVAQYNCGFPSYFAN
jgi:hypothetical protein